MFPSPVGFFHILNFNRTRESHPSVCLGQTNHAFKLSSRRRRRLLLLGSVRLVQLAHVDVVLDELETGFLSDGGVDLVLGVVDVSGKVLLRL